MTDDEINAMPTLTKEQRKGLHTRYFSPAHMRVYIAYQKRYQEGYKETEEGKAARLSACARYREAHRKTINQRQQEVYASKKAGKSDGN